MLRPFLFKRVARPLVALAALALVASGTAGAKDKSFLVVGTGVATEGLPLPGEAPRPHWIVGFATHLGLHTGEGTVKTDTVVPDLDNGRFTGEFGSGSPFVFVGADGDKLACNYGRGDIDAKEPGTFELTIVDILADGSLVVEALFIAEFVVIPEESTGKFAGAKGSWIMYAQTAPFVLGSIAPTPYGWVGSGKLNLKKPKK